VMRLQYQATAASALLLKSSLLNSTKTSYGVTIIGGLMFCADKSSLVLPTLGDCQSQASSSSAAVDKYLSVRWHYRHATNRTSTVMFTASIINLIIFIKSVTINVACTEASRTT